MSIVAKGQIISKLIAGLTETGAVVLNFLAGYKILKILNIPTVSTHYRMQKYVNKICLQYLMTEIYAVCLHFDKIQKSPNNGKKISKNIKK